MEPQYGILAWEFAVVVVLFSAALVFFMRQHDRQFKEIQRNHKAFVAAEVLTIAATLAIINEIIGRMPLDKFIDDERWEKIIEDNHPDVARIVKLVQHIVFASSPGTEVSKYLDENTRARIAETFVEAFVLEREHVAAVAEKAPV